jgi:hypothetical protein
LALARQHRLRFCLAGVEVDEGAGRRWSINVVNASS